MGFGPSMTPAVDIGDIVPRMDYWSSQMSKITLSATPADIVFPSVTVAGLPNDIEIIAVYAMLKVRLMKDTSGADNYINEANKTIRAKKFSGEWGTDDIVAIGFAANQWYTTASTKESGDVMMGNNDIKSVVDGNSTYNFRTDESAWGNAISALAASLELYDVQVGIRVYYKP